MGIKRGNSITFTFNQFDNFIAPLCSYCSFRGFRGGMWNAKFDENGRARWR